MKTSIIKCRITRSKRYKIFVISDKAWSVSKQYLCFRVFCWVDTIFWPVLQTLCGDQELDEREAALPELRPGLGRLGQQTREVGGGQGGEGGAGLHPRPGQSCTEYFDSSVFANSWDRLVLFGLRYLEIYHERRSSVFGLRDFFHE